MIRPEYYLLDLQDAFIALFKSLTTAPWNDWSFVKGYPHKDVFKNFSKPIIFLESFFEVEKQEFQGAYLGYKASPESNDYGHLKLMQAPLGIWINSKRGGPDEMQIIKSRLMTLLVPGKSGVPSNTFNVTYSGSSVITGTTLFAEGIKEINLNNGRPIATEDDDELREELILSAQILYGESVAI